MIETIIDLAPVIISIIAIIISITTRFNDISHLAIMFREFKEKYEKDKEEIWKHVNQLHEEMKDVAYLKGKLNNK